MVCKSARIVAGICFLWLVYLSVAEVPGQSITQHVTQQGAGQQSFSSFKSDPNFDVNVAKPAFATRHPKILFDEAHLNEGLSEVKYLPFTALLKNDGFSITVNKHKFAPDVLAGYEVLIVVDPRGSKGKDMYDTPAFTDAECDAVRDWVKAGGALLFIGKANTPGGGGGEMASRFGVGMSNGRVADEGSRDSTIASIHISFTLDNKLLSETHPIMRGRSQEERVSRVITYSGQSMTFAAGTEVLLRLANTATERPSVTGAQFKEALAKIPAGAIMNVTVPGNESISAAGRAQAVALSSGKGRVVVVGDDTMFLAQVIGGQTARIYGHEILIGMNVPGYGNRQLALNVMRWLAGALDPPKVAAGVGLPMLTAEGDGNPPVVGSTKKWAAPSFAVTTLEGKQFELNALRGKIVVLNFWFIGCAPCIAEIPELNKLANDYKEQKDVVFLALALDAAENLREFLKKHEFGYNIAASAQDTIVGKFEANSFPTHIIIDRDGKVVTELVAGDLGGKADAAYLRAALERMIKGDKKTTQTNP
jgi:peroxiredoxin